MSLVEFLKHNPMPEGEPKTEVGDSYTEYEIDGVPHSIITKVDGTVIKTNIAERTKWSETKHNLLEQEFPNIPFQICLAHTELISLDEPFTDEPVVFVKDDRACKYSYYWKLWPELERNRYNTNIKISKKGDNPITLRQIILEMAATDEYQMVADAGDNHIFLEWLQPRTPIQYAAWFGS